MPDSEHYRALQAGEWTDYVLRIDGLVENPINLTMLAYEMNDAPLTEAHGAPLRLRNEHELGFKMVKWIEAIEFVDDVSHLGLGLGGYNEDHEYYGYRMPI